MAKVMTKHVHALIDGVQTTLAPGDPAPEWVKNPKVYTVVGDEAETPEAEKPEADKAKTPRRRAAKADPEPTLAEKAKALGIDIDPDWTEAELEAAIATAE